MVAHPPWILPSLFQHYITGSTYPAAYPGLVIQALTSLSLAAGQHHISLSPPTHLLLTKLSQVPVYSWELQQMFTIVFTGTSILLLFNHSHFIFPPSTCYPLGHVLCHRLKSDNTYIWYLLSCYSCHHCLYICTVYCILFKCNLCIQYILNMLPCSTSPLRHIHSLVYHIVSSTCTQTVVSTYNHSCIILPTMGVVPPWGKFYLPSWASVAPTGLWFAPLGRSPGVRPPTAPSPPVGKQVKGW